MSFLVNKNNNNTTDASQIDFPMARDRLTRSQCDENRNGHRRETVHTDDHRRVSNFLCVVVRASKKFASKRDRQNWPQMMGRDHEALFRQRIVTGMPDNKKIGCFFNAIFILYFKKQPSLLLNGDVIRQASDLLHFI